MFCILLESKRAALILLTILQRNSAWFASKLIIPDVSEVWRTWTGRARRISSCRSTERRTGVSWTTSIAKKSLQQFVNVNREHKCEVYINWKARCCNTIIALLCTTTLILPCRIPIKGCWKISIFSASVAETNMFDITFICLSLPRGASILKSVTRKIWFEIKNDDIEL